MRDQAKRLHIRDKLAFGDFSSWNADYVERAIDAAGNWRDIKDFFWSHLDDPESAGIAAAERDQWLVHLTRDNKSSLLQRANSYVVDQVMSRFADRPGDMTLNGIGSSVTPRDAIPVRIERDGRTQHGWAIRVYRGDRITEAFIAWVELERSLEERDVLDQNYYDTEVTKGTIANIECLGKAIARRRGLTLPADWAAEAYRLISAANPEAVAPRDGNPAFPSEETVADAVRAISVAETLRMAIP